MSNGWLQIDIRLVICHMPEWPKYDGPITQKLVPVEGTIIIDVCVEGNNGLLVVNQRLC